MTNPPGHAAAPWRVLAREANAGDAPELGSRNLDAAVCMELKAQESFLSPFIHRAPWRQGSSLRPGQEVAFKYVFRRWDDQMFRESGENRRYTVPPYASQLRARIHHRHPRHRCSPPTRPHPRRDPHRRQHSRDPSRDVSMLSTDGAFVRLSSLSLCHTNDPIVLPSHLGAVEARPKAQ